MELFLKEGAFLPTKSRQGEVVRWGGAPLPLAKWRDKNEVEEKRSGWQEKKSKLVQASLKKVRPAVKRQWRSL